MSFSCNKIKHNLKFSVSIRNLCVHSTSKNLTKKNQEKEAVWWRLTNVKWLSLICTVVSLFHAQIVYQFAYFLSWQNASIKVLALLQKLENLWSTNYWLYHPYSFTWAMLPGHSLQTAPSPSLESTTTFESVILS